MNVAHRVQQFVHLALPGLYHAWIRMAGRRDAKRRCQIEILFTFGIPDMHTARSFPHNRPRVVRLNERDVARFVKAQELEDSPGLHRSFNHRWTRINTDSRSFLPAL